LGALDGALTYRYTYFRRMMTDEQKIIAGLLKELDSFARGAIKAELESLDPLLKNLVLPDHAGDGGDDF
jgi:hypothetical protein